MDMMIRYIRNRGQIVATLVAVDAGKVGVSFVHKHDEQCKREKVDKIGNQNIYQYKGFRKHVGIEQAAERAFNTSKNVPVPRKKIDPRNDGVRYPLSEVVAVEFDKMVNRSLLYFKN